MSASPRSIMAPPSPAAIFLALLLAAALLASGPAFAADAADAAPQQAEPEAPSDPFGRQTPRSMQIRLFNALGSGDVEEVVPYVEGADAGSNESRRQVRAFMAALDRRGELAQRLSVSIDAEGDLADGLAPDLEEIGTLALEGGTVPIVIRRASQEGGPAIWQVSAETLDAVPADRFAAEIDDDELTHRTIFLGAPLSVWTAIIGGGLALFTGILLVFNILCRKLGLDARDGHHPVASLVLAAVPPLALMAVYAALDRMAEPLGASLLERTSIARLANGAVAVGAFWLAWRLAGGINRLLVRWLRNRDQPAWIGLSNFVTRLFRLGLVVVAIAVFLATFAIDVTTGLAALGIGGIALALGARKAVEDIVGSVMILADKPVRIGDRCRVDGIEGDVVDIGMRSTRIQTLDRTLMTIPNNVFASRNIENLTLRDRYFVEQRLTLSYDTEPDRLEHVLQTVRETLEADPSYIPTPSPVRFEGFTPSGFELLIRCCLARETHAMGRLLEERILLRLLRRLAEMEVRIVPSTQRIEWGPAPPPQPPAARVSNDVVRDGH
ncbi:mechanosensitive ion channel family protein [Croceicoccus marinus]|nr:mechanosensitive ion channel family protein [Croceicoccus marinus]